MKVAALVVSIIALCVSGASALYAWRTYRINRDRRREELKPEFDLEVTETGKDSWKLTVQLETPRSLSSCRLLALHESLAFDPTGELVDRNDPRQVELGPFQPGVPAVRAFTINPPWPTEVRFAVTCRAEKEVWNQVWKVQIPVPPWVY
ncbi:hypothetical protein [Streptomyces sp. NPDC060065]|uniref:hypothetical protein n=1 Tax=Streptomyces sp. NPDC060065 TaxID=3347050 RepID=UPI003692A669